MGLKPHPFYMSVGKSGLLSLADSDCIIYVNDVVRDKIANSRFDLTTNYANVDEFIKGINEHFEDDQYWFVLPLPVYNDYIDYVKDYIFPNAITVTTDSVNVQGTTLYSGVKNDTVNKYCRAFDYGKDYALADSVTNNATITTHLSDYVPSGINDGLYIIDFCVLRSDEYDAENKTLNISTTTNEKCFISIQFNVYTGSSMMISLGLTMSTLISRTPGLAQARVKNAILSGSDPYGPGGDTGDDETEGTGGEGTYDDTTEQVDVPDLPTLSATDSGFLTLYNPSLAQLQALGSYMWSPLFDLDTFKKLFSDPMGAILGLAIVPVVPPVSGSVSVVLGNVDSGITMPLVSSQYVSVNLGTVTIEPYWGAYLDYSPYTTVEIYLPFIGSKRLDADDVMGHTIGVTYQIDLLSGACVALVTVDGSVMYQYIGQCSSSVPITGNDLTNVINGALSIAGAIGGAATIIGSGGATSPAVFGAISVSAHAVMGCKPRVEKSGATSGMGGMLAVGKPYVTITRPRQALPANQNRYTGYPSFITRTLGTLSGYTEVLTAHLEGMTCTDQEKQQITQLLSQGVFF